MGEGSRSPGKNYAVEAENSPPSCPTSTGFGRTRLDSHPGSYHAQPGSRSNSPRSLIGYTESCLASVTFRLRFVSPAVALSSLALLILIAVCPLKAGNAAAPSVPNSLRPADPLSAAAVDHYYNLDHDAAVEDFEKIAARHPNDAFALNHLLSATLIRELYRMGAINTGDYANDSFVGVAHRPADPAQKERIRQLVAQAEKLENAELAHNPDNIDMLYARGVTRGQFAIYTALIERAWFSSLRNAVGARHDHERVLELDPKYTDAKLVVGSHNYVMGSLPFTVKVAVALVGLSGDKQKGLQYLYDAYHSSGETSVDAGMVLLVFLRREHRYAEAMEIAAALAPRFPRNYLLPLEQGNLFRATGKLDLAEQQYRTVWQNGREGKYGSLHYELAALALGDLLRNEKKYAAAAAAYDQVGEVSNPDPEFLQKANLGAGEMYDQLQNRDLAVRKYEAVVAVNSGSQEAERARKRLKEAYRE
jgi:tetratricopeptide (TPR) repeat protein